MFRMNLVFTNCFLFLELDCSLAIVDRILFFFTDPIHQQVHELLQLMKQTDSFSLSFVEHLCPCPSFSRISKKSFVRVSLEYRQYGDANILLSCAGEMLQISKVDRGFVKHGIDCWQYERFMELLETLCFAFPGSI